MMHFASMKPPLSEIPMIFLTLTWMMPLPSS